MASVAQGGISIGTSTVSENFNGMASEATGALPANWRADNPGTVRTVGTYAAAGTATTRVGGANLSTSAANGIYNFGFGIAPNIDRAVGFLSSGTGTRSGNLYVEFTATTALSALSISYDVEKWRNGLNAAGFSIQMYHSLDGSSWTSAGASFLTSFTADANNNGFATPPGATRNVAGTLTLPIAASSNFYLAWNYSVTSGTTTTNAQALALDNLSFTGIGVAVVVPEPGTIALAGIGALSLVGCVVRRKRSAN